MLYKFIQKLNKEEVRHYKLWSSRSHAKGERKDLVLFERIRKGENEDEVENHLSKIWYEGKKNALYRLKNRVQQDINQSLWHLEQTQDPELQIWQWVGVARHWSQNREYSLAAKSLQKAKLLAEKHELLDSLQLVYDELIKTSHHVMDIDVEEIVRERRESAKKLRLLREMDDLLALVSQRLKTAQSFSTDSKDLYDQLDELVQKYQGIPDLENSRSFRTRMFKAVSRSLLQQHAYDELYTFTESFLKEFKSKDWFKEGRHQETQMQMLTFLANSAFRLKRYEKSLQWADQLKKVFEKSPEQQREYKFYYYNIRVINLSVKDKEKALAELEIAEKDPVVQQVNHLAVFIYLNRFQLLFQLDEFKPALKAMQQLVLNDSYPQLPSSYRLRIALGEIIARIELEEWETIEYRLPQIERDFEESLKSKEFLRERKALNLFKAIAKKGSFHPQLSENAKGLESMIQDEKAEDIDVIFLNPWLRSKFELRTED